VAICCSKPGVANPNWSLGRIGKKSQKNINFLDQILAKAIEKSLIFDPRLGRRKFFLDRGLAIPDLNTQL
jgi:hypothetical protein